MPHWPLLLAAATLVGAAQPAPKIVATLIPNGTYRMQGTLRMEKGRRDNESRARIALLNGPPNAQLGWVIRKGACGESGAEMGSIAAYRAIQTRGDGSVEMSVNLPMTLPTDGAYHVDILQERGSTTILACGGFAEDTEK